MTTRETLHALIDSLPEGSLDDASRTLTELRDDRWAWLDRYADIDPPYSAEELQLMEDSFASIRTGDNVPNEVLGRMLDELCAEISRGRMRVSSTS